MRIRFRWPKIPVADLRRVQQYFGRHLAAHRAALMGGGACLLGMALVEMARPWPLKLVFDYVLLPKQQGISSFLDSLFAGWSAGVVLAFASLGLLVIALLSGLFNYGQTMLLGEVGHKVIGAIRLQMFSHIQRLPQSYHDQRETGDLMMRITGDLSLVKDLLVTVLMTLGSRIIIVLGMLAAMFWLDTTLTLIALSVVPVLILANTHFSSRIKEASRRQRRKEGLLADAVHESFVGIGLTKIFAQEKKQEKRFSKGVSSDVRAGLRIRKLEASFSRSVEIIAALGMALVLWFGVRRAMAHELSAGDLLIFVSYMRQLYRPVRDAARLSTRTAKALVSAQRVIDVLEIEAPVDDDPSALSASGIKGDIRFDRIRFAYHSDHPVLHDVSFAIPPGETTAIIGPSGSGKSTIAKLLLRLYEPTGGQIIIDGRDCRDYRVRGLRKQIAGLSQDITMFHASIRENIAFARPDATFEELVAAATKVGAHDFIEALPDGYETNVGEGGLTLSGGQRQRLAFARAALRDSRIMIFDEPATGLDAEAERAAKDALASLKEGRTLIIITHRLNFLDLADHAILIKDGQIVDEGAPGELLARGGPFQEYVRRWYDEMQGSEPGSLRAADVL